MDPSALKTLSVVSKVKSGTGPFGSLAMMFLLRSAFWLTVAFVVIRPDVDLGASAEVAAGQALAHGSQFVAEQIAAVECDSLQCIGGKAVIAAALPSIPPSGAPMHVTPQDDPVPYPRPRPDRAG